MVRASGWLKSYQDAVSLHVVSPHSVAYPKPACMAKSKIPYHSVHILMVTASLKARLDSRGGKIGQSLDGESVSYASDKVGGSVQGHLCSSLTTESKSSAQICV